MTLIEKIQNEISENEIMYATIAKPSHQMANAHVGTIAGLMIALNLAKEHSNWIRVDERLPDTNDWVLVYYEYYAKFCDKWDKRVSFGFYDGKVWRDMEYSDDKNCYYELNCVKFWQPLPQPPSEVQSANH